MSRPFPVADPDTAPFWSAAAQGMLRLPRCPDCDLLHFPPSPRCPTCLRPVTEWCEISGRGFVFSWTTVHTPLVPGFVPPWTVVEVEPVEQPGLLLVGNLAAGVEPRIGLEVRVTWTPSSDGSTQLPVFEVDR